MNLFAVSMWYYRLLLCFPYFHILRDCLFDYLVNFIVIIIIIIIIVIIIIIILYP